jgi:hypothetical protein
MTGHAPSAILGFAYIACVIGALMAWVTHIIVCIKSASYLFLIAGAILPPIGVIHSWGVWLGVW